MALSNELKFGRAALKIISKDINQIFLVGKSVVLEGKSELLKEFSAMFTRLDLLLSEYNAKFESCYKVAIEGGEESSFPTKEDLKLRNETLGVYYKAVEFHQQSFTSSKLNLSLNQSASRSKLPKISVPKFSGLLPEWPNFKQLFLSMVHNNSELSVIEKYYYLADALQGEAKSVIATYMVDEQNYMPAWNALLSHYDDKRVLAASYINKVLDFPLQVGPCSLSSLQSFISIIGENVTAFKNIKIENEVDFLLLTLALRKLDSETQRQFETQYVDSWPSFKELIDFVRGKCKVLKITKPMPSELSKGTQSSRLASKSRILTTTGSSSLSRTSSGKGVLCSCRQNHHLYECPFFRDKSPVNRKRFLKGKNVCFNCLRPGHYVSDCISNGRCRTCKAKHHTLLHDSLQVAIRKGQDTPQQISPPKSNSTPSQASSSAEHQEESTLIASVIGPAQVLLGTAEVLVPDSEGILQPVRLLIDCGSQFSLITVACARRLGLSWHATKHNLITAGQNPMPGVRGQLRCLLQSRVHSEQKIDAQPLVVQTITGELPIAPLSAHLASQLPAHSLADPLFWKPRPIEFLLGNDLFMKVITGAPKSLSGDCGSLSTIFGLILMGNIGTSPLTSGLSSCLCLTGSPISADLITRFWETEEVSYNLSGPLDDPCEEHFLQTHYRDASGRYVVSLPFKESPGDLSQSATLALSRFQALESRLQRNLFIKSKYVDFMEEYEKLGHMAPTSEPSAFVIPHHCVFKPSDFKIRVVFDASMSTSTGSLNSKLHVGRKLQLDICDIILNFRRHAVAITADLVKMYRQILVNPRDRKYQHIFWRASPLKPLQTYELRTVTYGTASAPFAALRTIHQLIKDEGQSYPWAARVLQDDIYVDDIVTGAHTLEEALKIKDQLTELLGKGQFQIHKWSSNDREFMRLMGPDAVLGQLSLEPRDSCVTKILGMSWDPVEDKLFFKVNPVSPRITKRSILSSIARLYDPLGMLAPVIFKAKCILKTVWLSRADWDEQVPASMAQEWLTFSNQLPGLESIKIPRFILFPETKEAQVFGFCDASQKGFAAALYLRTSSSVGQVHIALLKAKTKLAPTKTISIPRLELAAAHLLMKLKLSIKRFLDAISVPDVTYFTDSTIVLAWLGKSPHELQTFVANRIAFILDNSEVSRWQHVASAENPADIASRGCFPEELVNHESWWAASKWLYKTPLILSRFPTLPDKVPELRPSMSLFLKDSGYELLSWVSSHSRYKPMLRTLAYALRFISNARSSLSNRTCGPLLSVEMENALTICIKAVQQSYFAEEFCWREDKALSKRLMTLAAFKDERGILRVGGRLENSDLPYPTKHSIILPGNTHLTHLLVDHYHLAYYHLGSQALRAFLRRKFWIFRLRQTVRSRLAKCITCFRMKAKPVHPFMGNLPNPRVRQGRPFMTSGVDYAGPFSIRQSSRRNSSIVKAYLAVFVCFATKAVHLEIVSSLSAEAFLAAFDRFIARRGLPERIYSDCGRNFVGAAHTLQTLFAWIREQETRDAILRHASAKEIQWLFVPPYAPHFGGLWEAAVKSAKYHLCRVIRDTILTFEELSTVITRIEAILNSRPLCPLNDDPEYGEYLTPGHFLIGAPLIALPEQDLSHLGLNRLSRWQLIKSSVQHFWKAWSTEYLHTLQRRPKWYKHYQPIKEGDLVLLVDSNTSPLHWQTARVVTCHPGDDGVIRVVTVKNSKGTVRRALSKLVPLSQITCPEEDTH